MSAPVTGTPYRPMRHTDARISQPRRCGIVRLTPEALGALLQLPSGIRVHRVQEEHDLTTRPADVLVVIEDMVGDRLPLVHEGCVMPIVEVPT